MAKRPTITTVDSGYTSQTTINNNFTNVETAFDNTLSRDGSTPNNMEADLDLDGNDLLNGGTGHFGTLNLGGSTLVPGDTLAEKAPFNTLADMIAATNINVGDYVQTLGYNAVGDKGQGFYRIVAAGTGTDDGGAYHDLTGITGQAELQHTGTIRGEQWGATDGVEASAQLEAAFDALIVWQQAQAIEPPVTFEHSSRVTIQNNVEFKDKVNGNVTANN